MNERYHIIVLSGGDTPEREISLVTGEVDAAALKTAGHTVEHRVIDSVADVLGMSDLVAADIVFPALHGGQGEDGHLQAVFDVMGVVYALSGPTACGLAMDKSGCKRIMRGAGIPTADWLLVCNDTFAGERHADAQAFPVADLIDRVEDQLGWPVVIKPNQDGSSVGVRLVENAAGFAEAFTAVAEMGQPVLVECFIPGRELTATVLLGRRLPLIEIRPRSGFYDFTNKYTTGACEYLCPAPVHSPVYERVSDDAQRLYDLLGCRGVARVDFRLDGDTYSCLEINAIPGMTANSLTPMAAAAVGISFADMLTDVCRDAVLRAGRTAPEPEASEE
jgi:D-alanine-D-alanine ligase